MAVGAEVEESFLDLATTGVRVRLLSHGSGPPLVLLHGVSLSAAAWAPLFTALSGWRLLAVDLPGHGLSDPDSYRRGQVRQPRARADRRHLRRARTRRGAGRRPLAGRDARALVRGRRRRADLPAGRDRRARSRAPGRPRTHATVAADGPRPRSGRVALTRAPAPSIDASSPRASVGRRSPPHRIR